MSLADFHCGYCEVISLHFFKVRYNLHHKLSGRYKAQI